MIDSKVVSSLKKIFLKEDISNFKNITDIRAFKGERVSYQIVLKTSEFQKYILNYELLTPLKNVEINVVGFVPSECPVYEQKLDEYYITKEPGLFPDVLYPLDKNDNITVYEYTNTILWITVEIPYDIKEGKYPVILKLLGEDIEKEIGININVEKFVLPESDLIYTNWLHSDCIASYYNLEVFSEEYWNKVEAFMKMAAKTGVNTILTPIITPPIDTKVDGERPTVQLVDIELKEGKYYFNFDKLEKWVKIAKKVGIKNFEMAHLFTQWGAEYTPKIIVNENGKNIKKFGWHIKARSDSYKQFLEQFLPALVEEISKLGIKKNVFFHISDEPSKKREKDFENYLYAKGILSKYLKDFKIIDALSNIEFYKKGLIEYPIPATNKIEPFLEENIQERWCYYCCSQAKDVSNRFMAMPSYRTRMLGIQLYLLDMIGFLHWGFNFYYSYLSEEPIDPFKTTDAKQAYPSGDSFIVYPYIDGPIESIRSKVFYEGLQDRMMLKLLEDKIGKEKTKNIVEELANKKITFKDYPHNEEFLLELKDKVLNELKK